MTKREAILRAVLARLTGLPGVPDASVERSGVDPLSRAKTPAVNIEPVSDQADESMTGVSDWSMVARISVIVRGDVPDQLADPIIESIHTKICADLSFGGLVMNTVPVSVNFEMLDGDKPVGIISLDYRLTYRTMALDLSN